MELWIRSQNKKRLIKCEEIEVVNNWICVNKEINVGSYLQNGEKRALEVLDEIQNLIKPIMLFQNCECDNNTLKAIKKIGACMVNNDARIEQINQTVLYQMPEE